MADNKMSYQMARRLKDQSLGSVIADELISGEGFGSAIGKAIGLKTQARATRIKAKFDPLNIAKFLTGGSRLGPAILGKLTGRSRKDIEFFTGRARPVQTSTKIGKLLGQGDSGLNEMLDKIYTFMKKNHEEDVKHAEVLKNFREEMNMEEDRRHDEFMKALKALSGKGVKATAEKIQEEPKSFLDELADAFGMGKDILSMLRVVGPLLANPIVLGVLGAVVAGSALAYLLYNDKDPEATSKAILNAGAADGGLSEAIMAASEDVVAARKNKLLSERESEDKSLLFWKDPELQQEYLKKIGWDEKSATTKADRDSGIIGFNSDGQPIRKTPTEMGGKQGNVPATALDGGGDGQRNAADARRLDNAQPLETPPPSSKLNDVVSQNANLQITETTNSSDPTVITNTKTNLNKPRPTREILPAVRNQEETFQRMILNSTRVV